MERLFSPCTRYRDRLEIEGLGPPDEELQEQNLDISIEELLSAERAFTYADLYAMLGNVDTVVWLTPHAAVVPARGSVEDFGERMDEAYRSRFNFDADGKGIVAFSRSLEHLLEICDVIARLLAASVVQSVCLDSDWVSGYDIALINAPTLAYLMEHCQSLKVLSFTNFEIDENHCRVLGTFSRPGLEIELHSCMLTSDGTIVLAEILGRNQGPTRLDDCEIDYNVISNCLRGNSRLRSFGPRISNNCEIGKREVLAIASALKESDGLVELDLTSGCKMSDEVWAVICDSLKTHPTLQVLDLRLFFANGTLTGKLDKSRIQALVDMLKINMSIHTIHMFYCYSKHELFRGSVIPHLEANRLRPRVRAIQKTRPISYRAKLLGRALLAVRTDPNRFWMLLSGNAEVAFPSTIATTIAAATNLPMPATAAVTVTVTVTDSTTRAAFTLGTPDIGVAPASGHKRKSRP
jgi:hypothetical protein